MNYKMFYGKDEVGEIRSDGVGRFSDNRDEISPIRENLLLFLSNALPEGERYENLLLRSKNHNSSLVDNVASLDELPSNFSIGQIHDVRKIVSFPQIPPDTVMVDTDIPESMFFVNSKMRGDAKPSFSGYQDKFTAKIIIGENGRLIATMTDQEREIGNIIVKPGVKFPFIAENEFVCMRLAGKMGFDVPNVFLIKLADSNLPMSHLCVERFDFDYEKNPVEKRPMMEFASLMGLDAKTKYLRTTEEFFGISEGFLNEADFKNLARAYMIGVIVGNGDMHTKNFSVFTEGKQYLMSPIYDMLNTKVHGFEDTLALPIFESCTKNPNMENFVEFMERYMKKEEILGLANGVKEHLPEALSLAFSQGNDQGTVIDRQRAAFCKELEDSIICQANEVERVILQKEVSVHQNPKHSSFSQRQSEARRNEGRGGR